MQYNLYGWYALVRQPKTDGKSMMDTINRYQPDFLGIEEGENRSEWIQSYLPGYRYVPPEQHGVSIFYQEDKWQFLSNGTTNLNEHDQWGQRIMRWARFAHIQSGTTIYFDATHWCVCDENALYRTAKTVAESIAMRSHPDPVILVGDLNVFGGFEISKAVKYLTGKLGTSPIKFRDTFRDVFPTGKVYTFGHAGKVDYIFATDEFYTLDSIIDHNAKGSDHAPVIAYVCLGDGCEHATKSPTAIHYPTYSPTKSPTSYPTDYPTTSPTPYPTKSPTKSPTKYPTLSPTGSPTGYPTGDPTGYPTGYPTQSPTNYSYHVREKISKHRTNMWDHFISNSSDGLLIVIGSGVAVLCVLIVLATLWIRKKNAEQEIRSGSYMKVEKNYSKKEQIKNLTPSRSRVQTWVSSTHADTPRSLAPQHGASTAPLPFTSLQNSSGFNTVEIPAPAPIRIQMTNTNELRKNENNPKNTNVETNNFL